MFCKLYINRDLKKEQNLKPVEYFKYSKNIEIMCDITQENKVIIEIVVSENSLIELAETVEKFINLFKK